MADVKKEDGFLDGIKNTIKDLLRSKSKAKAKATMKAAFGNEAAPVVKKKKKVRKDTDDYSAEEIAEIKRNLGIKD